MDIFSLRGYVVQIPQHPNVSIEEGPDPLVIACGKKKTQLREVKEGLECGIGVENFNDVKVGDVLEVYQIEEIVRTLEPAAAATDA